MGNSKKIYRVVPHQSVEPIHLGMSRAESRAAMNMPVHSFKKSGDAPEVDSYHSSFFQVFFDEEDNVEYIELSKSHDNSFTTFYENLNVHETKAEEVLEFIKRFADLDENERNLGHSYVFLSIDLSVWRPTVSQNGQEESDEEGRFFTTIGIGKAGYYKHSTKD